MLPFLLIPPVIGTAALIVYLEASGRFLGSAPTLTPIDVPIDTDGLAGVEAWIQEEFHAKPALMRKSDKSPRDLLAEKRRLFDAMGTERTFDATFTPATASANGLDVPGEWTTVKGSDPDLRLIYYHGGGFTVGSPQSHRALTVRLARDLGASVFAPDYRLRPEHAHLDAVADCAAAYRWVLDNSPSGSAPVRGLFVAGDSAGGNLSLVTLQWARDQGLRPADACAVFSPSTDYTLTGKSLKTNFKTDTMLRPLFAPFMKVPKPLLTYGLWKTNGARPSDARISPLFGDLAGLPPTLIQVSPTEILYDDATRYAAQAANAGSPVQLEVFTGASADAPLPHVWQMFDRELPAARDALDRTAAYLLAQIT